MMAKVPLESHPGMQARLSFLIDDLLCQPAISARERAVLLRLRGELSKLTAGAEVTATPRSRSSRLG